MFALPGGGGCGRRCHGSGDTPGQETTLRQRALPPAESTCVCSLVPVFKITRGFSLEPEGFYT